jgi:hypothetical protein
MSVWIKREKIETIMKFTIKQKEREKQQNGAKLHIKQRSMINFVMKHRQKNKSNPCFITNYKQNQCSGINFIMKQKQNNNQKKVN